MIPRVAEWLLTYFVHSSVLLLLVAGLVRLTRDEATLERLWRLALVGPVLSTTLLGIVPAWIGPILSPNTDIGRLAAGGRQIVLAPAQGGRSSSVLISVGLAIWAIIALLSLAQLLRGHLKLARLIRGKTRLTHSSGVPVFVTPGIRSPIALLSGDICLPPAALRHLNTEELDAVLIHEQEHIRRRDPLWLVINAVICRVLFFQPANWVAARQLRGLAEFLCDRTAASRTSPVAIASALATVSAWIGEERVVATGLASSESLTLTRVKRILNGASSRDRAGRMAPVAGAFLLGLSMVGPGVTLESNGLGVPYTIAAYDDGGRFSVTIDRGKVTGVTLNGVAVPAAAIEQEGNRVRVIEIGRVPLLLTLTENGGMRWTSRSKNGPAPISGYQQQQPYHENRK